MNSKIYRANTMKDAVAGLRRDLGADAVILSTRTVRRRGLWGWLGATLVEVQAASAAEVRAARQVTSSPAAPSKSSSDAEPAVEPHASTDSASSAPPSVEHTPDREATRRMARAMLERLETDHHEPKPGPLEADVVRSELSELRDLVGQVLKQQALNIPSDAIPEGLPEGMIDWYVRLISNEVSEELAATIVHGVCNDLGGRVDDADRVRERVVHHLSSYIPISTSPLPPAPPHGPLILALVGPTGVGKTTTAAKIAASCRLHRGAKVGLMTCDTYRIAAVDQLRTYAEILGLPLAVLNRPEDMTEALARLHAMDVIIIDTPGRSQRDEGRIDELGQFLKAARPHQTHLVLSGTAGEQVLLREAEAFLPLGVDRIVLTKLDEAVSYGMLIEVLHRIGRKLSFLTTGQEVPSDIEPASGDRLATMVLRGLTTKGGTLRGSRR